MNFQVSFILSVERESNSLNSSVIFLAALFLSPGGFPRVESERMTKVPGFILKEVQERYQKACERLA